MRWNRLVLPPRASMRNRLGTYPELPLEELQHVPSPPGLLRSIPLRLWLLIPQIESGESRYLTV